MTWLRKVAALTGVDQRHFLRMSTAVRTTLNSTTSDDIHTILEAVDAQTGVSATAALMPENPVLSEFGTVRTAIPPRQMAVGSDGTVYALTVSGLSVVPLAQPGPASRPQIASSGVMNSNDATASLQPGSFLT